LARARRRRAGASYCSNRTASGVSDLERPEPPRRRLSGPARRLPRPWSAPALTGRHGSSRSGQGQRPVIPVWAGRVARQGEAAGPEGGQPGRRAAARAGPLCGEQRDGEGGCQRGQAEEGQGGGEAEEQGGLEQQASGAEGGEEGEDVQSQGLAAVAALKAVSAASEPRMTGRRSSRSETGPHTKRHRPVRDEVGGHGEPHRAGVVPRRRPAAAGSARS